MRWSSFQRISYFIEIIYKDFNIVIKTWACSLVLINWFNELTPPDFKVTLIF